MSGKYVDTHPQFTVYNPDTGGFSPAVDGEVEFFTAGNTGDSNRKDTFSDPDLFIPNPNPMPLDGFGRSINPVFLDGIYNTVIRDVDGNQLDQVDNVSGGSAEGVPSQTVQFVADLRPIDTLAFQEAYVINTATPGDGGQGHFRYDATATESDNDLDVIEPTVGGGRWLLQNNAHNSIGVNDAAGTTDNFSIAPSPEVTFLDNTRVWFVRSLGPNTFDNTGGETFAVGTSAALPVRRSDASFLRSGDTGVSSRVMILILSNDNTYYALLNPYRVDTPQYVENSVNQTALGLLSVGTPELIPDSVTNDILADMPTLTLKGNDTGSTGGPLDLTAAQAKILLDIASTDVSGLGALALLNTVATANLDDDAVTNQKLANMATQTMKGRNTAGTGDPEDLSASEIKTLLALTASDISGLGDLALLDSVSQSELDTSVSAILTLNVNTLTGPGMFFTSGILGGGVAGFYLESAVTLVSGTGNETILCLDASTGPTNTLAVRASVALFNTNNASAGSEGQFRQTFVNASPPFNIGDGDIANFTYILMSSDHEVKGVYCCEVPPWAYNGPTRLKPTRVEYENGNRVKKFTQVIESKPLAPWLGGDIDEWRAGPVYKEVLIDHSIKNADMGLLPHPFDSKEDDEYVLMLEPCCSFTDAWADAFKNGEDVDEIIRGGYVNLTEEVTDCCKPDDVKIIRPSWKIS